MTKTPEQIMQEFANEHSYETWGELMYDTHESMQVIYTKEVMMIFGRQCFQAAQECWEESNILFSNDEPTFEPKYESVEDWLKYTCQK